MKLMNSYKSKAVDLELYVLYFNEYYIEVMYDIIVILNNDEYEQYLSDIINP